MATNEDEPSVSSSESYVGVWDSERECWIADADDPSQPIEYAHPWLAKCALDMYASPRWESEGRYEVRDLPDDTDGVPLSKPT